MDRKSHAYHVYEIYCPSGMIDGSLWRITTVRFQHGPITEVGVNGCSNEDLLAIVVDRLECLQNGKFPCRFNEHALEHIKLALGSLYERTDDREKRGVEGKNVK